MRLPARSAVFAVIEWSKVPVAPRLEVLVASRAPGIRQQSTVNTAGPAGQVMVGPLEDVVDSQDLPEAEARSNSGEGTADADNPGNDDNKRGIQEPASQVAPKGGVPMAPRGGGNGKPPAAPPAGETRRIAQTIHPSSYLSLCVPI